jgi:hypothetical protein
LSEVGGKILSVVIQLGIEIDSRGVDHDFDFESGERSLSYIALTCGFALFFSVFPGKGYLL